MRILPLAGLSLFLCACEIPWSDAASYPQLCLQSKDGWKPQDDYPSKVERHKASYADQSVLVKSEYLFPGTGPMTGLNRLEKCVVWDNDNWSCGRIEMLKGAKQMLCESDPKERGCVIYPGWSERMLQSPTAICKKATTAMEAATK